MGFSSGHRGKEKKALEPTVEFLPPPPFQNYFCYILFLIGFTVYWFSDFVSPLIDNSPFMTIPRGVGIFFWWFIIYGFLNHKSAASFFLLIALLVRGCGFLYQFYEHHKIIFLINGLLPPVVLFFSFILPLKKRAAFFLFALEMFLVITMLSIILNMRHDLTVLKNNIAREEAVALVQTKPVQSSIKMQQKPLNAKEIFNKFSDAVVLIRVYSEDGKVTGFGTGFNILEEGLIVTNSHVVFSSGSYLKIKFPNHGLFEKVGIIGVAAGDEDLCLLTVKGGNLPVIPLKDNFPIEVGEKIFVMGNPEGFLNTISEGIVSGIRGGNKDVSYYQITAPISPGSSGGPVFNEFGFAIGVATLYSEQGQNLNFAVSVDEINKIELFDAPISLKSLMDEVRADDKRKGKRK